MEDRPHRLETGWRPNGALVLASLSVAGTAAIGCLLFAVPRDFPGWWGLAPEGADRFAQVLGPIANVEPLRSSSFAFMFRLLLLVACVSWLGAIVLAFRGACPPKRPTMALVVAGSLLLAFLAPPVLSRDVFGYVAYHRVPFRYGLNPYIHGRSTLEQVGDPSAAFIVWDTPLPYGPLWPLATVGF